MTIKVNGIELIAGGAQAFFEWLADGLPEIVYYDDFTFEVPETICFLKTENSQEQQIEIDGTPYFLHTQNNQRWKIVISEERVLANKKNILWHDILNDLLVGGHKMKSKTMPKSGVSFQKDIVDCDDTDVIDQRLSTLTDYLNKVVTKDWEDITGTETVFDSFRIERVSESSPNFVSFALKVKAKDKTFALHERSKGCRWFFCFKILTDIRTNRGKNGIVFLLDEPASNLHIHPQEKILKSLQKLSRSDKNIVIYSTHSPYLVEETRPNNLFAIRNEASECDEPKISCSRILDLDPKSPQALRAIEPFTQKTLISMWKKGGEKKAMIEAIRKSMNAINVTGQTAQSIERLFDFVIRVFHNLA